MNINEIKKIESNINFGKEVRKWRQSQRLSLKDASSMMGISPQHLQRIEVGTMEVGKIKAVTVLKIARITGVKPYREMKQQA